MAETPASFGQRIRGNMLLFFLVSAIALSSFFSLEVNRWLQAAIAILLAGAVVFTLRGTSVRRRFDWVDASLTVFLAVGFASVWFSGSRADSLTEWTWLALFGTAFWITRAHPWDEAALGTLRASLFSIVALFAVVGLVLWAGDAGRRFSGLLQNANAAGPFLAVGFVFGLGLFADAAGWRRRIVAIGETLVVLALALTGSYTTWIALAVVLFFGLLFTPGARHVFRRGRMSLLFVLAAVVLAIVGPRFLSPSGGASTSILPSSYVSSSFSQRLEFNRVAFEMFRDHPLLGVGLSQYQRSYPPYAASIAEQPRYVHNYYLQTFAELGGVGGFAFLGFLWLILRRCWRMLRAAEPSGSALESSVALAVFVSVVASAVDFSWQFPAVFLLFWVMAGALTGRHSALSTEHSAPSAERPVPSVRRIKSVLLGILATLLFLRGVSLALAEMAFDEAAIASPKGQFERAIAAYDRGVRFEADPVALRERAWLQLLVDLPTKRFERTERALRDLQRGNEGDYFAQHTVGRIRFVQDRFDEAEAAYRRALELDPVFHPDFAYDLGFLYLKEARYADAERTAAEMLGRYSAAPFSSNPQLPTQLAALEYLLGEVSAARGETAQAIVRFERSLARDATFGPATNRLSEIRDEIDAAP